MRFMAGWLVSMSLFASLVWGDEGHHHALTEQEIGSVHFATSCAKTAETSFNHAVALLHSFQYEDSRQAFEAIARQDPTCAMAQWGVAMSYYHGLWRNGDTAAGREAWHRAHDIAQGREGAGQFFVDLGNLGLFHSYTHEKLVCVFERRPSNAI